MKCHLTSCLLSLVAVFETLMVLLCGLTVQNFSWTKHWSFLITQPRPLQVVTDFWVWVRSLLLFYRSLLVQSISSNDIIEKFHCRRLSCLPCFSCLTKMQWLIWEPGKYMNLRVSSFECQEQIGHVCWWALGILNIKVCRICDILVTSFITCGID